MQERSVIARVKCYSGWKVSVNVKKFGFNSEFSFNPNAKFAALIEKRAKLLKNRSWSNRKFLGLALMALFLGLLSGYTAKAAVTPTQEEWDAYAQLKPVKKMNYDKIYEEIEADVKRLSAKETQYAINLPLQLKEPMNAISGKKKIKRKKKKRKTLRSARVRKR